MQRKMPKGVFVTIVILFAIAFFGIVFSFVALNFQDSNFRTVGLKRISTNIMSEQGESHSLNADIAFKVHKNFTNIFANRAVQAGVADLMARLSFERVAGLNGIDYIRGEITNYLNDKYPEVVLEDVYVTAFISDHELPGSNAPSRKDNIFKGLFSEYE